MASSIRAVSKALPRVSMARIPLVAFANTHVAPAIHAHATSTHPSAYSSMPSRPNNKDSSWSDAAHSTADKLEKSAKDMDKATKDYLREVKQYENEEDEVLMELGLAMSSDSIKDKVKSTRNQNGGKRVSQNGIDTFEEKIGFEIQADVTNPSAKASYRSDQHNQQEFISSLCEELKAADLTQPHLSQHASEAIRMVESHNILKQDKAPVHDISNEDPAEKAARHQKHH
ncbi:hypothetical protein FBU30_005650 [Linnemannia zychae]|nr:hypothetical protein FBU30_005650 [Linnemannia zychae]